MTRSLVDEWSVALIAVGAFDILNAFLPATDPIFVGACLIFFALAGRIIMAVKA